ncbi:MAG TPA: hypothetical protein VHA74_02005 [Candidatus Dojkabacteria bacterium]|nr:hypothetical protein [Candidatus Dojkabacteria bacterium]
MKTTKKTVKRNNKNKAKSLVRETEEKSFSKEIKGLMTVLSGEKELRKKEEEIGKLKDLAVKQQKEIRRRKVLNKEVVLTKDEIGMVEEGREKKVVQNIKLYSWDAPVRFKLPFNEKTFFIILGVCLLFTVYLAVVAQYGLMASVIALMFFIYIAGTTPPYKVTHEVTARGIDSMGKLYEWFMLGSFWFAKKENEYLMVVDTKLKTPSRLLLFVTEKELKVLFILLQDKLVYKDIRKQSWLEKQTYGEYIPLEKI